MAITKSTVTSFTDLANWLQENAGDLFSSVTLENNILSCYNGENLVFKWDIANTRIDIYKSESVYVRISLSSYYNITSEYPALASACSGGIMVNFKHGNSAALYMVFSKTNNGETACVAGMSNNSRANALTSGVHSVAWGDAEYADKTRSFYASDENQTQFVEFATYSKPDTVSYTPKAFYLPAGQYYDLEYGKFIANGKLYITNGYWAIIDE